MLSCVLLCHHSSTKLADFKLWGYDIFVPYLKKEAIILSKAAVGEHDKRLTLLLDDGRLIEAKVRRARDVASKWGSVTEPVSHVRLELYERGNHFTITGIALVSYMSSIYRSFESCVVADYMIELVSLCTPFGCPETGLFDLVLSSFEAANDPLTPPLSALASYMLTYLSILGYSLNLNFCHVCGAPIEGDCFFDVACGSVVCGNCAGRGLVRLPFFALSAMRGLIEGADIEMPPKLAKGIVTLLSRVYKDRFEACPKSSLHILEA